VADSAADLGAGPYVIGVAGGTGSGKTTVAERLVEAVGAEHVALLRLDSYYADQPHLPLEARAAMNYDHPDAFDWPLLLEHVRALGSGRGVAVPTYDFTEHRRCRDTEPLPAARVLVLEGILVLTLVFAGGATGVTGYVKVVGASSQVQLYVTGSNVQQQNPNQFDSLLDTNTPSQGFPSGNFTNLGFVGGAGGSGSPNGNENFAGMSFAPGAVTTTTVTSNHSTTTFGNNVTFTATVTSPVDTPAGTVTFFDGTVGLADVAFQQDDVDRQPLAQVIFSERRRADAFPEDTTARGLRLYPSQRVVCFPAALPAVPRGRVQDLRADAGLGREDRICLCPAHVSARRE
jgi:hypothetical protein